MTYSLRLRVESGQATITNEANVPDGEYEIHGHEDGQGTSIQVVRRGLDGRFVAGAQHHHPRES